MAGVSAAEAPARRHAHIANQHVAQLQVMHLGAETLNKQDEIGMAEIAPLILAHHLIVGRVERQRLCADDAAVGERADRLRAARDRLLNTLPRRRGQP